MLKVSCHWTKTIYSLCSREQVLANKGGDSRFMDITNYKALCPKWKFEETNTLLWWQIIQTWAIFSSGNPWHVYWLEQDPKIVSQIVIPRLKPSK